MTTETGIDFTALTDAQLTEQLAFVTAQNAKTETVLRTGQRIAADLEAEQSRRRLAAYWVAHPELTPVADGDELLVIPDFVNGVVITPDWSGGESAWVDGIYMKSMSVRVTSSKGSGEVTFIPISLASNMRAAYLRAHVADESG